MQKRSTSTALSPRKSRKKQASESEETQSSAQEEQPAVNHDATIPLMMRPKISQKECVEEIAEQIGTKRSQLDPTFYLTGALLTGLEKLGKAEQIGTWTRKEVAVYLKGAFTPLFELLYEQNELPLVFSLLLANGAPVPVTPVAPQSVRPVSARTRRLESTEPGLVREGSDPYMPLLGADVEVGLDGFPGGI